MTAIDPATVEWAVLVYRVPSEPASKRVAVWRDLKRLGGLYVQQCVCILPKIGRLPEELERIAAKIPGMGGEYTLFDVPALRAADRERITASFRALRNKEYAEIVEECETKFLKEVEFEHFRQNYSFEEAEEIGQDLDKIRRWFDQVQERDWFAADGRQQVAELLERCQEALGGFEEEVYRRRASDEEPEEASPLRPSLTIVEGAGRRAPAHDPPGGAAPARRQAERKGSG
jgi:hypothetical protein